MRYSSAAFIGFLVGTLVGIAAGGGPAVLSLLRDQPRDPSTKAAFIAETIARTANCAAFGAIAGSLTAVVIAYARRKKR
jgi:hypothetical protein